MSKSEIKIGTVTFHRAINVGALLQAYALQSSLQSLGVESEVVDYRPRHIEYIYSPFYVADGSLTDFVKMIGIFPIRIVRNYRFKLFTKEFVNLSRKIRSNEDFELLNDDYSMFFVGSDQVWSPYHVGRVDGRYFLDFVNDPAKKKSYAASFGLTDLPVKYHKEYSNYLKCFSDISVREQSAVLLVDELSSKSAKVVLDPVYLVDEGHWKEIAKQPKIANTAYLLLFVVNGLTDDIIEAAREVARENTLKIVFLAARPQIIKGVKVVSNFAPREFLGYVMNATHVITDSFHAMSFSIIFKKDFSLKIASQHGNKNNRSLELMERLGIRGRLLGDDTKSIDWSSVAGRILLEREQSLDYLRKSIES